MYCNLAFYIVIIFLLKNDKGWQEQKTTFNNLNVLNFPVLKNLKSQIIKILELHNLLLGDNWAQLYNKSNKHSIHTHPYSDYSGIIYLNPVKPSPTIFDIASAAAFAAPLISPLALNALARSISFCAVSLNTSNCFIVKLLSMYIIRALPL